eukprot:CAMPEP_0197442004 /NCGR_PEP_ID=MMETSP1175-20131217/8117_1 /TAXON_ID=1003142 /ORGANISM="Triceratium dubium, Strain CCMP147" /LENGTH=226 /DNA_ID=CAMNT_0042972389 /DNA_START=85 /DNA_END=766 /DNA_ORIENTATION=-
MARIGASAGMLSPIVAMDAAGDDVLVEPALRSQPRTAISEPIIQWPRSLDKWEGAVEQQSMFVRGSKHTMSQPRQQLDAQQQTTPLKSRMLQNGDPTDLVEFLSKLADTPPDEWSGEQWVVVLAMVLLGVLGSAAAPACASSPCAAGEDQRVAVAEGACRICWFASAAGNYVAEEGRILKSAVLEECIRASMPERMVSSLSIVAFPSYQWIVGVNLTSLSFGNRFV